MKKKHLTPHEAWADFYQNYKESKPSELYVAQKTYEGKAFQKKSGKVKELGPLRIRRLLDKYAPGQYEFHEGQPYFVKGKKSKPPTQ